MQTIDERMKNLDFLLSLRGLIALLVVFDFEKPTIPYGINGMYMCIICFFLLSSFLLTYRLLKEFEGAETLNSAIKITTNYFSYRFFRYYMPYLAFLLIIKYFFKQELDKDIWSLATLELSQGSGYLWPIAIEIRYYVLVPIVAFSTSKLDFKHISLLTCSLGLLFAVLWVLV
jgi:peptidoglycan/LPS O-acetylase OafA/YrhL